MLSFESHEQFNVIYGSSCLISSVFCKDLINGTDAIVHADLNSEFHSTVHNVCRLEQICQTMLKTVSATSRWPSSEICPGDNDTSKHFKSKCVEVINPKKFLAKDAFFQLSGCMHICASKRKSVVDLDEKIRLEDMHEAYPEPYRGRPDKNRSSDWWCRAAFENLSSKSTKRPLVRAEAVVEVDRLFWNEPKNNTFQRFQKFEL